MQFQEERVRWLTRQLEAAHGDVSNAQNKRSEISDRIKLAETQINQAADPNNRKQMDYELAVMKTELDRLNALEQQFRTRETEVNLLLQSEQSKWNEINDQLVSFERALSQPATRHLP